MSVTDTQLLMKGEDEQEHSHALKAGCKVTCDGTPCKAKDLKPGMRIRVTTVKGDQSSTATHIEAIDKSLDFASI